MTGIKTKEYFILGKNIGKLIFLQYSISIFLKFSFLNTPPTQFYYYILWYQCIQFLSTHIYSCCQGSQNGLFFILLILWIHFFQNKHKYHFYSILFLLLSSSLSFDLWMISILNNWNHCFSSLSVELETDIFYCFLFYSLLLSIFPSDNFSLIYSLLYFFWNYIQKFCYFIICFSQWIIQTITYYCVIIYVVR